MNKMRIVIVMIVCLLFSQVSFATSASIGAGQKTVTINKNQKKTVNVVTTDLNNKKLYLDVILANNKIGGHENFSSMVKRKASLASINANYFDAYKTLEPIGAIMKDGKMEYLEGSSASLVATNDGKVSIGEYNIKINGYINGFRENRWNNQTQSMDFNVFNAWYVNRLPTDKSGVYIYTPARGNSVKLNGGIAIEVKNSKVTKITKNAQQTVIPKDGYIIYYGSEVSNVSSYVSQRFKIGNSVELENEVIEKGQNTAIKSVDQNTSKALSAKNTKLFGSINKKTKNEYLVEANEMRFYLFNIWYINANPNDSTGVYLYTPEKGESVTVNGGHAITVKNGVISNVEFDVKQVNIPKDGFSIYYGKDVSNSKKYVSDRFKVGDSVDFYNENTSVFNTSEIIKKAVKDNEAAVANTGSSTQGGASTSATSNLKTIISAGPYLVKDGKNVYNANNTAFKEAKIATDRAQRSAVGITKDNKLIMVTGSNLNMNELSQVMIQLGSTRAMNLDGGASSGLYGKGKILTTPGRKLHTVLSVQQSK